MDRQNIPQYCEHYAWQYLSAAGPTASVLGIISGLTASKTHIALLIAIIMGLLFTLVAGFTSFHRTKLLEERWSYAWLDMLIMFCVYFPLLSVAHLVGRIIN